MSEQLTPEERAEKMWASEALYNRTPCPAVTAAAAAEIREAEKESIRQSYAYERARWESVLGSDFTPEDDAGEWAAITKQKLADARKAAFREFDDKDWLEHTGGCVAQCGGVEYTCECGLAELRKEMEAGE